MKKGLTLIEVIVSIGILGLIISTLLLVIYNIQLSQAKMIFSKTIAKKAEFYVLKNLVDKDLYVKREPPDTGYIIESILQSSLPTDPDLKEIRVKKIEVTQTSEEVCRNLYLVNTNVEGDDTDEDLSNNKNIYKHYFSVKIDYEIMTIKKEDSINISFPLIMYERLEHNPPSNNPSLPPPKINY